MPKSKAPYKAIWPQHDAAYLERTVEAARAVQQLMLPNSGAATAGFALDAVYEPAAEVGGDFHWSRTGADGSLIAVVGDVSGKGLKAAILVSVVIGILRTPKSRRPPPSSRR